MIFRPSIRIVFLSFLLGITVLLLFLFFNRNEGGETYGILTVDEAIPDRSIGGLLKAAGFDGYFSESSTVLYVDDFGQPKKLYLDRFREELEPNDPRDDGYAEKLRSFFVHGGRRYFYIPLGDTVHQKQIVKDIGVALGIIPYSLEIITASRPVLIWFAFQLFASLIALVISRDRLRFTLQIPIILAFAWLGLSGLIMAGILAGLWELLREPFGELFSPRPFGSFGERLRPYRYSFFWLFFFIFLFTALCFIWTTPLIPVWVGFFCFFILECVSFIQIGRKRGRNLRFTPVLIITLPKRPNAFRFPTMVFAASSLLALVFFFFFPGVSPDLSGRTPIDLQNFPSVSEYEEYMAFQASFSMLPLGAHQGEYFHNEYLQYYLGDDGLIAGAKDSLSAWEIPAFPLEKLTDFLLNYENRTVDSPKPMMKDWVIVVLILMCCIPNNKNIEKRKVRKNKIPLIRDPRVAA